MDKENIIRMAREAWIMDKHDCSDDWFVRADIDERNIFKFAALVADAARGDYHEGWDEGYKAGQEDLVEQQRFVGLKLSEIDEAINSNITITDSNLRDGVYAAILDAEIMLKEKNESRKSAQNVE